MSTSIIDNARNATNVLLNTVEDSASAVGKFAKAADTYADVVVSHAEHVREQHEIKRLRARATLSKADCVALGIPYTGPTASPRKPRAKKTA